MVTSLPRGINSNQKPDLTADAQSAVLHLPSLIGEHGTHGQHGGYIGAAGTCKRCECHGFCGVVNVLRRP